MRERDNYDKKQSSVLSLKHVNDYNEAVLMCGSGQEVDPVRDLYRFYCKRSTFYGVGPS